MNDGSKILEILICIFQKIKTKVNLDTLGMLLLVNVDNFRVSERCFYSKLWQFKGGEY